jgi:putative oxidoreductase
MADSLQQFSGPVYSIARIVFAFLYLSHGLNWLFGTFGGMQAEFPSQFWFAGVIELVFGSLLLVGLFTRFAAFIASGEMAVAYFIGHVPRGSYFPIENGGEITVAFCFMFFFMIFHGGGPFSVDRLMKKK